MENISKIMKFLCLPFRQEVELLQVDHAAGFRTLRLRIREGKRFTILDIDAATAESWGTAMKDWANVQAGEAPKGETSSAG